MPDDGSNAIDFAMAAYLEEETWQVVALPGWSTRDLATMALALRRLPGDSGAVGLVAVDDDFFILIRVRDDGERYLLSDVTAATEWPLAREVLDRMELPVPDDEEDQPQPGGDLGIVADLGMSAMDMAALCDDLDLSPEDMLTEIAERLGFGTAFRRAVDAATG